jgi:DNA repair protein RAD50
MHASKAILENVIFCHQEDTSWPFSDPGNLKKVFDEIFDTAKYTKALEELKDLNKEYQTKSKEAKQKIELIQKDFEQYRKLNYNIEAVKNKIEDVNGQVSQLKDRISNYDKDYRQIIDYEEKFNKKQVELSLMKTKFEEKIKQIETIKNDPYFIDYTDDETIYQNYINNHGCSSNDLGNRAVNLKNNIEQFAEQIKTLAGEINNIDSIIHTKIQLLEKFNSDKLNIINELNNALGINIDPNTDLKSLNDILLAKEEEIKNKLNIMDDKKKIFESKLNEKNKEEEVNRCLLENKTKEINMLVAKKDIYLHNIQNKEETANKIIEFNDNINSLQEQIRQLEESDIQGLDNQFQALQNCINIINQKATAIPDIAKRDDFVKNLIKLKEVIAQLKENERITDHILTHYNTKYRQRFEKPDDIISYINNMKNEISEQKQVIREQNYLNNHQIEQTESEISKINSQISQNLSRRNNLFEEVRYLFDKFNISYNKETFNNIDINKLLIFQDEVEKVTANLKNDKSTKQMEIKFLEEYIRSLYDLQQCCFCQKDADKGEMNEIKEHLNEKIELLKGQIVSISNELENKLTIAEEISKVEINLKELKSNIDDTARLMEEKSIMECKLNKLFLNRKVFENNSKDKSQVYNSFEAINIEEINKVKSNNIERQTELAKLQSILNIHVLNENEIEFTLAQSKEFQSYQAEMNVLTKKLQELQGIKSTLYEQLNRYNNQLRSYEGERNNLTRLSNAHDSNDKLLELEADIAIKDAEKHSLLTEKETIMELKNTLLGKKAEFDSLYNDKYTKNKILLEKINIYKVKLQCNFNDFNHYALGDYESEHQTLIFEKSMKEKRQVLLEKEISKLQEEYINLENENKKQLQSENIFKNNIIMYNLKREIRELKAELDQNENKLVLAKRMQEAKDTLMDNLKQTNMQYNINIGKLSELNNNLTKLTNELKLDTFFEIEGRYNKLKMEYVMALETSRNIEK